MATTRYTVSLHGLTRESGPSVTQGIKGFGLALATAGVMQAFAGDLQEGARLTIMESGRTELVQWQLSDGYWLVVG